jgi:hypothetical protein
MPSPVAENLEQRLAIQDLTTRLAATEERLSEAERRLREVTAAVLAALDPAHRSPDAIGRLRTVARGWRY